MATEPALTLEVAQMLRFPPFPTVPDGVELISFISFKPSGIRVPIDEDDENNDANEIERDGLGIPTIALRAKHVSDGAERKKKKKKKKVGGSQQVQVAPERPKTWWEVWEELEDIRKNVYDMSVSSSFVYALSSCLNDETGRRPRQIVFIRQALISKMVVLGHRLHRVCNMYGI